MNSAKIMKITFWEWFHKGRKMMGKELTHATEQFASISIIGFVCLSILSIILVVVPYGVSLKKKGKEIEIAEILNVVGLIVYINIILQLTLLGRENGSKDGFSLNAFSFMANKSYMKMGMIYALLNVLLFVPFGFLCSANKGIRTYAKGRSVLLVSLLSLFFSLIIELLQYIFGRGYYEIEDLICNTAGGLLGAVFFRLLYIIFI